MTVDRSRPPAPGKLAPYEFPRFVRRRLPGGLTVLPARLPRSSVVSMDLLFPAGGWYADVPGLASLVSGLLDEGTEERSALEIAAAIEQLGGRLATSADWNVGGASVRLLARFVEEGMELLSDLARHASFPDEEVKRALRHRRTDLMRRLDQPDSVADDHFARLVYGDSAYGFPLSGTPESVDRLDRRTMIDFYRHHYLLEDATLLAVGDFDPDELVALAERHLDGPERPERDPSERPRPHAIEPIARETLAVRVVDRPGAAQTELRVGGAGPPRSHPDWTALTLLNTLFGGKFTSRLNLSLREKHGYTYGANSRFRPRRGPGPFVVSTAVENPVVGAAAGEILDQIRGLTTDLVTPTELEDTRNYAMGIFPFTLQTVDGVLQHLENLEVYDLPDDHYLPENYLARLAAVTREDLLAAARAHLHPERAVVVAAGPAAEIAPQLADLAEVEVVSIEAGEPVAE